MRVMSWNLFWRFGEHWQERQSLILSTLESVRPDIAGLQEVWGDGDTTQAHQFADALGMHAAYSAPSLPPPPRPPELPDQAGGEVGVAVLSRWPIIHQEEHLFPSRHRPEEIVALTVAIDHPAGVLHVVTSCIDWERSAKQRLAQTSALAALLTDRARDGAHPAFLTADLNSPPDTREVQVLTDVAVDAWPAARGSADPGHTLSTTNPLAPREAWQIDHRIDYVLARPGRPGNPVMVDQAFLAGDRCHGLPPSDHYAVVADFCLDT